MPSPSSHTSNLQMEPDLTHFQIEVWDDEIIVSVPGTSYAVTYYKPANSPQLLAKDFPYDDDRRTDLTFGSAESARPRLQLWVISGHVGLREQESALPLKGDIAQRQSHCPLSANCRHSRREELCQR